MTAYHHYLKTLGDIRASLESLAHLGCRGFDIPVKKLDQLNAWSHPLEHPRPPETLEQIRDHLGECRRCRLWQRRKHIVFGTGDPNARLVFVGEGPGSDEDQSGEPFVGAAGQLLTRIIEAMGLTRSAVYICNIIKCRPPGNRNPQPDEIDTCRPFLDRQLRTIRPEFICALGKFAAQTLLDTTVPISRLRGRFHEFQGALLMPTYHPAYLLRNPDKKRDVWEDIQQLMNRMGLKKA